MDYGWYGNSYGSLVESETGLDLMSAIENAKTEEERSNYLNEIRINFERAAKDVSEALKDDEEEA